MAMGGDQAAGGQPVVGAHPGPVQPSAPHADLALPTLNDLFQVPAQLTDEAQRRQKNLERRLADQQLLQVLADCDFTGPRYRWFEEELAAYAVAVLRGWMYSGHVFTLAKAHGYSMNPTEGELEELFRDDDAREELANMTVAMTLSRFKEQALVKGGWRFEGGASLPTYFMGACLYTFPNQFRARRVQRRRWRSAHYREACLLGPAVNPTSNPAMIVTGDMRVDDAMQRADETTRAILLLTFDGYTQDEIAEALDLASARAVEGHLYRWRVKEKLNIKQDGGQA